MRDKVVYLETTIRGSALLLLSYVALLSFTPCKLQAQSVQPRKVVHGEIPLDKEYWKYNRWYRNHSVLDVIVSGDNMSHLQSVLAEIEKLDRKGVLIRDIMVTGGDHFGQLDRSARRQTYLGIPAGKLRASGAKPKTKMPMLARMADRISLSDGKSDSRAGQLSKNLNLKFSPTWIITHRGKSYIYEGAANVAKQFSRNGQFKPSSE